MEPQEKFGRGFRGIIQKSPITQFEESGKPIVYLTVKQTEESDELIVRLVGERYVNISKAYYHGDNVVLPPGHVTILQNKKHVLTVDKGGLYRA